MSIERIDMTEPRPLPTPETMVSAMDWAGRFVVALMDDWPDHPYHYSPAVDPINVNVFPPDPAGDAAADRKRGRAVAHMCWELAADEALIVEFDSHDGFWMLSNNGVFFNSMDYLYRPVSYTPSRTKVDSDGKVRLILCHDDPGYHNWLDTQGFVQRQSDLSQSHERCIDGLSDAAREARSAGGSIAERKRESDGARTDRSAARPLRRDTTTLRYVGPNSASSAPVNRSRNQQPSRSHQGDSWPPRLPITAGATREDRTVSPS